MKTKRTFSLSQKGKVLAFCLGEKTKAFMPTSFLARAAMMLLVMVLTATTAWADPVSVSYIDANGNTQNADATVIDGTQTTLAGGWYVVNSDVALTTKLNFTGDTHLILADGKTLSIDASNDDGESGCYFGLSCKEGTIGNGATYHDLTIYGQAGGTGKISANIGHPSEIWAYHYYAQNITINGGIVEATGPREGVKAIQNLTIKGGKVISTSATISGKQVTLGWRNSTDYIQAKEIYYTPEGSIQIANGKVFTDGTSLYNNTTMSDELHALSNVTLRACLVLAADASNAEAIANYSGKTIAVALNGCTLKMDGKWNSLCLPFDVTIANSPLAGTSGDNPEAKVFSTSSSLTDGTLTLKFVDAPATIPAGTPFIIKWAASTKTIENPVFVGVTISNTAAQEVTSTDTKVKFVGQYSPFGITNENINEIIYLGDNDAIGYASSAMTLPSFGTHFVVPTTGEKAATSIAMSIVDWSGSGSEDDPYIISNTDQLDLLAQRVNAGVDVVVNGFSGKFFKLGDNIAYNKETANNFTPIGDGSGCYFYGTFDGDGKTISGININSGSAEDQAIFGFVNGTVKNLVISNCSIVAKRNIGAIAGVLHGTIENCRVENNVTLSGWKNVGGIVGSCERGTIKGCSSAATITGTVYGGNKADNLGGIVGATTEFASTSPKLTDNIFTGTITGSDDPGKYIGAIVGENNSGTLLTNNVYTSTGFGGIVAEGSTTSADDAGARKALTISAADGVTITPTGTATTYDVSGITVYADNSGMGYDSKFYAGATDAVKLTIAYTVPEGYTFGGYAATNGGTISGNATDGYTLTMPAANVTVTPTLTPIEYTLQYNGADGATFATANPTTYTVESDAITLTNPTKDGYTFAGWTGTGLTEATTTVTIAKGSTGNREYTATWSLADYTITYDLAGGTLAEGVSNPTGYNIDSDDITLNNPTREGYTFAGWTGTGLTEATTTVTIAKGSHENKTFTATWEKNPDTRYVVDADGVAVTTMAYLAELALDDTMQDYVEKGKLKATITPKNKYWTLACGVDLLLPEGVKVYKARMNSAGTKVELTEIDAATLGGVLKANNGVLIASTPGQSYDLVVSPNNSVTTLSNADAKSYGTDNELEPVLEDTHFTTEDYFILTENKFIMVDISKDTKVPAGKAVLKVAAGSAKTRTLDVIDGETTGISSAVNSADDEVWYNLQGQRISKPTRKGVYILNGKKVRK